MRSRFAAKFRLSLKISTIKQKYSKKVKKMKNVKRDTKDRDNSQIEKEADESNENESENVMKNEYENDNDYDNDNDSDSDNDNAHANENGNDNNNNNNDNDNDNNNEDKNENEINEITNCSISAEVEGDKVNMQPPISDFDIISIYADISKLSVIERYLNMLYRPSTCFMRLNCYFKLSELECFLADTLYEPEKHTALFIRHTEPPCSLRLYDNGHICCQAYSYKSAALGIHRFIDTMEHLGYSPVFQNPRFNVVNATFCMPFGIDLTILCIEYCEDCDYMPEAHPYLIFKMRNSSTKLAIFNNGCVYVMLSSTPRHTQQAIAYIMPILFRHKDTEKPEDPELRIGDINFKLLWENEFQRQYQNSVNYSR